MLRTVIADRSDQLEVYRSQWDELAIASARPYSSPSWILPWWAHVAPPNALLRTVLVFDGNELVGVAPFYADRGVGGITRYRIAGSARRDVVTLGQMESDVAEAVAHALTCTTPTVDTFMLEGVPASRTWPSVMQESWQVGRMSSSLQYAQPAPNIDLRGRTYEEWFASKSRNFRQGMRRRLRKVEDAHGRFHLASNPADAQRRLREFARLHHLRWQSRGGSSALDDDVEVMLQDVCAELIERARFRLWSLDIGGTVVGSVVFVSAGRETSYWLGGFDERWAALEPTLLILLNAVRHSLSVGDVRIDLGAGGQQYKYRFSDGEDELQWSLLVRSGVRSPIARAQMLPQRTRMTLAQRTPARLKKRIRQARGVVTRAERSHAEPSPE